MVEDDNKPQDVKPEANEPKPDPVLISHIEKGYTPEGLEKREKK